MPARRNRIGKVIMSSSRIVSQACGECRARKIKCDLQKPACIRCLKSGRQCPGYRDQLALWFRDESQSVAQRTKATTHSPPSVGRRTPHSVMEEAFTKTLTENPLARRGELFLLPLDLLMVDVQDRASCYFFEVFDWVGASTLVENSFDYATDSADAPLGEQALLAGISAVGKASLANLQHSASLKESASNDYGMALKLVNMALGDTEQFKKDSTINAIFYLSIFEMVSGQGPKSIDDSVNHVNGAMWLLETRDRDDSSRTLSPAMFYSWRTAMTSCCLLRCIPIPSRLLDLSTQFADLTRCPISAASRELTFLIANLAKIRHRVDTNDYPKKEDILAELEEFDTDLTHWAMYVSPSCNYDTVPTPHPLEISANFKIHTLKEYSHRYSGVLLANMWNQYRTAKLQTHDMILTQLRPRAMSSGPLAKEAQAYCSRIRTQMRIVADEICCSAPCILGLLAHEKRDPSAPAVKSSAGGFFLLWPLTMAALAYQHPSSVCNFVFQCFDVIARAMGIHQALVFRETVISQFDQYAWADNL